MDRRRFLVTGAAAIAGSAVSIEPFAWVQTDVDLVASPVPDFSLEQAIAFSEAINRELAAVFGVPPAFLEERPRRCTCGGVHTCAHVS